MGAINAVDAVNATTSTFPLHSLVFPSGNACSSYILLFVAFNCLFSHPSCTEMAFQNNRPFLNSCILKGNLSE